MKIKNANRDYSTVTEMQPSEHKKPKAPNIIFRTLLKLVSLPELLAVHFKCRKIDMDKLGKHENALILMNHSSFIDLKIASSVLYPRRFNIVSTLDAFIGKEWLMRQLGCMPTRKFVADIGLVRDINYCIKKLGTSVLMYPEAGYSFDGRATVFPQSVAMLLKRLGVPLVMLETFGAYHRDPLYNELKKRKVRVSAELRYILSADEISAMSVEQIADVLKCEFSFDAFAWQKENKVRINEPFRADGLQRLLYKCPHCQTEGKMIGKGITLTCAECGKVWELNEYGEMCALDKNTEFSHIPDWYSWQRECVKREIEDGKYGFCTDVDIYMIVNTDGVWYVGEGSLTHNTDGFHLVGCDGQLDYIQKSASLYTLNADFYWYCLGDIIGIGNNSALYYCMPKDQSFPVAKARLATEEIYNRLNNKE